MKRVLMRSLFVYFICIVSLFGAKFEVTSKELANGTTILFEFAKEKGLKYKKIKLDKKSFLVFPHPTNKKKLYSLVATNYYAKPSDKTAILFYTHNGVKKTKKISLKIVAGKYKKEQIQVDSSKVNPKAPEVLARISKEYKEAMGIYASSSKKSYIESEFILPLESFITSDFGKARVYNGSLKGYHSGTDFRAKVGTQIKASNDGVVVLGKDRFYSGGTVILDHGHGIYTCYYHLSKVLVPVGKEVKKGDVIGLSGKSGRVTGPHLHFSVRVGGVQVDPLGFISLINTNLLQSSK